MDEPHSEAEPADAAQLSAYEQEARPVKAALEAADLDTRDFGKFVNRPLSGVIESAHFDAACAPPILLRWLPCVSSEKLREAIVRHLAIKTRDGSVADALIEEFRRTGSANHKWVVADALAFAASRRHFDTLTDIAADTSHAKAGNHWSGCCGGSGHQQRIGPCSTASPIPTSP